MLPRLLIATGNAGKFKELEAFLKTHFQCVSPKSISPPPEVVEDGLTYEENAFKKAAEYFQKYQIPTLSDDSGLEVDALNGAPGLHSARFGGENLSWPERWKLIHQKMREKGKDTSRGKFRCVLCYYDGKHKAFFEGILEGDVIAHPKGTQGFGYDPIFCPPELGKTLGEASAEEKDQISHRTRALLKFIEWWNRRSSP